MTASPIPPLPLLPLLLWETPPGLELALAQEGVPFVKVTGAEVGHCRHGRFVLFDGRRVSPSAAQARLGPDHKAIDVNGLRDGHGRDPFADLIDNRPGLARWDVGPYALTERVARRDRAAVRRALLDSLRTVVLREGGLWARLSPFPYPYRSAFNFRADLDETNPGDYARYARARRPLADCSTHFVSTRAYGSEPAVLQDLLRVDTQSHGHHHVIYRDPAANRRNIVRAHQLLCRNGFEPVGFAAPHGRWNPGLDGVLESLGYLYSSDFQVGYDDLPFFPWLGGRFSTVLQVPIHPVCEGLFFDAGPEDGRAVARHLAAVVRAKVEAREPAFVYGHPERRLGRHPEILATLARAIRGEALLWRVTLTDFARWWRFRHSRRWSLVPRGEGRYEVQFEEWSPGPALGLEVVREHHVATVPLVGPLSTLEPASLAFERRDPAPALPAPRAVAPSWSVRGAVRRALDWETVTPIDDLPAATVADRVKKRLRQFRESQGSGGGAS